LSQKSTDKNHNNLHQQMFVSMLRLRKTEQKLAEIYKEQIIRTPAHFGIGQEAVAVGVCDALSPSDVVYSHHRCHNHYLAQGGSLYKLVAELLGKEDGCSNGRGGSVHITDQDTGFIISSAILGQTVAVATGSALAFKMDKSPNVAVSFFGDAVLEEGVFWESLNYASIFNLPVLFVCEDNKYSTESHAHTRQPSNTSLSGRVKSFNVQTNVVDGNNVLEVFQATQEALEHCRKGKGPYFLECTTYRWLEHVGPYFDYEFDRSYRSREELDAWIAKDPIELTKSILSENDSVDEIFFETVEENILEEINKAVDKGRNAPWPDPKNLSSNVY
jgi:TPP-dependent pyruvate/acetoin dehydrogenase alpha subunit